LIFNTLHCTNVALTLNPFFFYFFESFLFFFQCLRTILIDYLINSLLFQSNIVNFVIIWLINSHLALNNVFSSLYSVSIEFLSILHFFSFSCKIHLLYHFHLILFQHMHFIYEILFSLHFFDTFLCSLFFFLKFHYTGLKLELFIMNFLMLQWSLQHLWICNHAKRGHTLW